MNKSEASMPVENWGGRRFSFKTNFATVPDDFDEADSTPALPSMALDMEELFGADGPLSRHKSDYTPRTQQIDLAQVIQATMQDKGVCVGEAGTGTGKSLAYLLPAIERALRGERTIISTHTIALQTQLFQKDIPLALEVMGATDAVKVVLLKGRSNFLCKMEMDTKREEFLSDTDVDFQKVVQWSVEDDCDGDKDNLGFVYEKWHEVTATHDSCTAKKCEYYDSCFYYAARKEAKEALIIIVNHALVMADLSLRDKHANGGLLPKYRHIVFDEAHHIEAVATEMLGIELAQNRILNFVNKCRKVEGFSIDNDLLNEIEDANDRLFAFFEVLQQRQEITFENLLYGEKWLSAKATAEELAQLCDRLAMNLPVKLPDPKFEHKRTMVERTADRIAQELYALFSNDLVDEKVRWSVREEARGRRKERVLLKMQFMHAGRLLAPMLWKPLAEIGGSAILLSATLATNGGFDYLRDRLSLPKDTSEIIVGSPFDYKKNAMLYVPGNISKPPKAFDPQYMDKLFDVVRAILALTEGRAFILFTSWNAMREMRGRMETLDYPLFVQGDLPVRDLVSQFKASGNGVLLGTASFWEGVDIPGEALSCVIMDKIPFTVPTSPLESARCRKIDEEHGKMASFTRYSIPQAQIKLKQGFGRLIRTQSDRGIVCILDTRLITENYGSQFINSLPPARRASKFAGLEKFWRTVPCTQCGDPFLSDTLSKMCAACTAPPATLPFD